MKKTIAAVLATLLASLCLVMIGRSQGYGGMQAEGWESLTDHWLSSTFVRTTRADDEEDLLRHLEEAWAAKPENKTISEHFRYLEQYFIDITGYDAYHWPPSICIRFCNEAARIYNEFLNDIDDHPYLRGTIDDETGEITITGLKYCYITTFYPYANGRYYDEDIDEVFGYSDGTFVEMDIKDLVIPDEINGHPVTKIADSAFTLYQPDFRTPKKAHFSSVVIGDNVREIGDSAFSAQQCTIKFGKSVETIGSHAFADAWSGICITDWGESLKMIGRSAFDSSRISDMPPIPDTVEEIKERAFVFTSLPETFVIPASVKTVGQDAFSYSLGANSFVVLSRDAQITNLNSWCRSGETKTIYCYSGSTVAEDAKNHGFAYTLAAESSWQLYDVELIDGDSLLWNGEAVDGSELKIKDGMTEAELREHLSIDGASSAIQIDGLENGKVVNGTTVTLFHTAAQAPGKVYTVIVKEPEIVSVAVETLPTKINYIYKEQFDPSGLSLRVTFDNGGEETVTDNITFENTNLKIGTNTITATYENVSATFAVTVRYTWWQQLIRIFLFGFLWY